MSSEPIRLSGYPVHMVHAEKIVTAVQRGIANTRWRDFGDIWMLARRRPLVGSDLQRAILEVDNARGVILAPHLHQRHLDTHVKGAAAVTAAPGRVSVRGG